MLNTPPQKLHNGTVWYYEYPSSIEIIVPRGAPNLGVGETKVVRIQARTLRKSLDRMKVYAQAKKKKAKT